VSYNLQFDNLPIEFHCSDFLQHHRMIILEQLSGLSGGSSEAKITYKINSDGGYVALGVGIVLNIKRVMSTDTGR